MKRYKLPISLFGLLATFVFCNNSVWAISLTRTCTFIPIYVMQKSDSEHKTQIELPKGYLKLTDKEIGLYKFQLEEMRTQMQAASIEEVIQALGTSYSIKDEPEYKIDITYHGTTRQVADIQVKYTKGKLHTSFHGNINHITYDAESLPYAIAGTNTANFSFEKHEWKIEPSHTFPDKWTIKGFTEVTVGHIPLTNDPIIKYRDVSGLYTCTKWKECDSPPTCSVS